MKLKFKAEMQDVVIFFLFAILLFFIVALGISNISTLARDGVFSGINIGYAFTEDRIVATLTFYFLALAGIFMSVSSYFFEREKGFGFGTEKSNKGYSRWAKDKEIQEENNVEVVSQSADKTNAAGIPLLMKKDQIWVDNGEYHNLVIGATGSGKTQTIIFPTVETLAKNRESMIITDPKGEIYEQTSNMLRDKGYNVLVLNFRDPQQGNAWNPLSLPYRMYRSGNSDKAIELLDDLAANILYEEKSGNADPFWEKTSADYFSGLALGLFEDSEEDRVNLNSISVMTTVGEEKFGGSTYIKEYFNGKDPAGAAYTNASGTIMAPNDTKGSIIAVFKQKIKLFASRENLSEMLSHSDIDLETIGEKPTVLYIVIQDEKKTYHPLVTILLKQCYETLISVAQKHGGKLPVRTNFLLDEFANMPPLKDITTMITAARSRLIRFTMIIQNFAQLDQVYGKENAETIKGNCGNIIYLITTELKALEEISKMCGEVKSKKDDKTASTPLVTISDLQKMKQFEVIILRLRLNPFKTKFIPYYKWDIKRYPKAEYPQREKQEVHTFDLKEFVKEKKKEKLAEMMKNGGAPGMPGMPGMAGMPGGGGMPNFPGMPNMGGGMPSFPGMPNSMMQNQMPMRENPATGAFPPKPSMPGMSGMPEMPARPSAQPKNDGFNVDDLIKKIDAKIAEIEEEEKKQKELEEKAKATSVIEEKKDAPKIEEAEVAPVEKEEIKPAKVEERKAKEEPKVEIPSIDDYLNKMNRTKEAQEENKLKEEKQIPSPQEKKEIFDHKIEKKEIETTDDQFFDDFFDDEV